MWIQRSVRLLALGMVLCAGGLGAAAPAQAEPARHAAHTRLGDDQDPVARQAVAVIDLTNDQSVRDVANKLLEALAAHADLAPPAVSDGAALVDKLPPDDEMRLADARKKLASAIKNLQQRSFREAAIDAVEGQESLLRVTPHAAVSLYADLALALGESRLGEQKEAEAREAFALTYRLDPHRTLDDLHYLPEVVQLFEATKATHPGAGKVMVRGAGRVWIDGEEQGTAPAEFPVTAGRHVVWLTGMMRETAGKEIVVTAGQTLDAIILDGPLTRPQKVVRLRIALSQAPDPAARAAAMKALAAFVNVHDAVLLSNIGGKILWQTWRDREPGFGEIHELGRDRPGEILKQLVPPRPIEEPAPPPVVVLPPPPRWYQRRSVQVGVAATIAAALVGGYFLARYHEADRSWNQDITGFDSGKGGR
ncbi:MAG: hypothetical protein E6J90_26160 [Deltaproteobacteria bacterium]|nr:MAG: hypothetical protein E6J91_24375 [Deltaproteobacteria bacterium]TMQ14852.1 MAG: hypothetical protein E6J90_26160 [Deltaproteobacteria bacterium]